MKRRDLIRHLEKHGCELLREGGQHSIYVNRKTRKSSARAFSRAYHAVIHGDTDNQMLPAAKGFSFLATVNSMIF